MPADVRHLEEPDSSLVRLLHALERLLEPCLLVLALPRLDRVSVLGQVVAALVDVDAVLFEVVVELQNRRARVRQSG